MSPLHHLDRVRDCKATGQPGSKASLPRSLYLDHDVAKLGQKADAIDTPNGERYRNGLTRHADASVEFSGSAGLPPSAYVWTEGSITAQPVGSLTIGQRTLCYDRLSARLTYECIDRLHTSLCGGMDDWVSIEFEDGTQQILASCHPMWPLVRNEAEETLRKVTVPVCAEMLVPRVHSIMLKKIEPVQVRSVVPLARVERAKMFVLLREHDRYQILITQHISTAHVLLPVGARNASQRRMYARDGPEGDCLPAGTFVWTEGSSTPQPLGSLKPWHSLLCYDRLANNVCYVAILELQASVVQTSDRWVTVVLQDGTQQDLLASCSFTPKVRTSWADSCEKDAKPTSAEKLSPHIHSLMVVKTVPAQVTKVTRARGTPHRIAVSLNHPSRYDMLVGHNVHGGGPMIAVGSVVCQESESDSGSVESSDSASSTISTLSNSSQSADSTGTEIIILAGVTGIRPGSGGRRETVLSSYISSRSQTLLKLANLGSLGSLAHEQGTCSMCIFHARYLRGELPRPCRYGFLCDWCHSYHPRNS